VAELVAQMLGSLELNLGTIKKLIITKTNLYLEAGQNLSCLSIKMKERFVTSTLQNESFIFIWKKETQRLNNNDESMTSLI
jgi:hypothetical protein